MPGLLALHAVHIRHRLCASFSVGPRAVAYKHEVKSNRCVCTCVMREMLCCVLKMFCNVAKFYAEPNAMPAVAQGSSV